jgi:hypothetical protein
MKEQLFLIVKKNIKLKMKRQLPPKPNLLNTIKKLIPKPNTPSMVSLKAVLLTTPV